jgi:hypothetical protein
LHPTTRCVLNLLHPMQSNSADDDKIISERLRTFGDKTHVKALREMIEIIRAPRVAPPLSQLIQVT